ncbi:PLP-dependent aminotransferase family protein [Pseudomonas sediminis]|uniref:DNA-binding protein n=1 Tax=Pseudomonas sediminis TaxID=1691904 RepID=A0A2G5FWZ6_9PSED|nr:PLP-dependent aminotransferase family protein [Pseudomonas sediminis]PIA72480.1 DNA-binding protein [Pseudomonas sediminis]
MHSIRLAPERDQATPIYLQLYRRLREAIGEGRLQPGERVPSVRALASELNLARGTVEAAYQLLIGEGYLLPRGPAGTVVSPQLPHAPGGAAVAAMPQQSSRPGEGRTPDALPFQLGLPALDAFPRKLWSRLGARHLRQLTCADLDYPAPQGLLALRRSLVRYLGVSRGITCEPQQVFITAGYRSALLLIRHALLQTGDSCWFEDPGYFKAREALEGADLQLIPVPVDDQGLRVDEGRRLATDARCALVTPSHQSPLGVSLSLPRRLALLEWARASQAWIVEDDYDSEYRYVGRPLPALKSLDHHGRVLYCGTFSKVLFPGVRLAYLVVPPAQVERFAACARTFDHGCPALAQAITADFLDQGHFARHLKRMRALYAQRRGFLAAALEAVFGSRLQVELQAGGIHLLARLDESENDVDLAARAQGAGLAVMALSQWARQQPCGSGLLLGFTNIASAEQALHLARRLATAVN